MPAPARRLSFLGSLAWAGEPPKPHAGSSDGDTASKLLSEAVNWLVLVWFWGEGSKPGLQRPQFFVRRGRRSRLCYVRAKGFRRSRWDCSGGPTLSPVVLLSRNGDISPRKQPTTPRTNLRGPLRLHEACHVQMDKTQTYTGYIPGT